LIKVIYFFKSFECFNADSFARRLGQDPMEDTLQDWTQSRLIPNDSGLDETKKSINQFQWKKLKS
jgi:hypothetical protein